MLRLLSSNIAFYFLLGLVSTPVVANQIPDSFPPSARYALVAQKLDEVTELNPQSANQYFPPASTLKVITALAAQLELGTQFNFQTRLTQSGQNYSLIFSGDPTLSSENIKTLLSKIEPKQNNTIAGDIWLDNTVFTGYEKAVGWPWDIVGVCYSAPASAINIDGNCIQSSIYTQNNGETRVFVPQHYPVYVMTDAQTVSKQQQEQTHCDLELLPTQENHYHLSGCLVKRAKPLPLKFAVQDTDLYAQRTVYKLLNQLGLKLKGEIKIGKMPGTGSVIATHNSEPLPLLLDTMLKDSDNLIADTLTKTIGQHFFKQAGSFNNGTEAIKSVIEQQTGISLKNDQFVDGSGLSRNNRIRVTSMLKILRYIWQHDSELNIIDKLPVSGESGTLKYRRSMRDEQFQGKIIAKSGSLYATHNMVGYGLDTKGSPNSVFIQFVTDYFPPQTDSSVPVESPLVSFEKDFYQQVIKLSEQ